MLFGLESESTFLRSLPARVGEVKISTVFSDGNQNPREFDHSIAHQSHYGIIRINQSSTQIALQNKVNSNHDDTQLMQSNDQ